MLITMIIDNDLIYNEWGGGELLLFHKSGGG